MSAEWPGQQSPPSSLECAAGCVLTNDREGIPWKGSKFEAAPGLLALAYRLCLSSR